MKMEKGRFVELDGFLAVIVGVEGDPDVPEDHVALWFGEPQVKRKSEGGKGGHRPKIYTVLWDLCEPAQDGEYIH